MNKSNFLSKLISLSLILVFFIIPAITAAISQPLNKNKTTPETENENIDTAKISLPFIKNQGQYDLPENVLYYTQTHAGSTFLTKEGLTYSILSSNSTDDEPKFFGVKESFILDSEREIIPQALSKSDTNVSYFIGGDEDKWQRNVPAYNEVIFPNVWESIDLNVKAYSSNVEKVFTVNPSANVSNIAMILDGVNSISIGDEQELILHREGDDLLMTKPIAFQFIDGRKENVEVAYNILSDTSYGFNVGEYNTSYPLIIDPVTQSTYVGGATTEGVSVIAKDSSGNIFVASSTTSTDFPGTTGGVQDTAAGSYDFFVAKLSSDLTTLTQATYIGTSFSEQHLTGIEVDSSDNVVIWGDTRATSGFPGINGSSGDSTYGGSTRDGVLVRISNDLTSILQSTYVGGTGDELATDMEIHPDTGDIYVTMECANQPYMTGGAQSANAGSSGVGLFEACIDRVSGDLTSIIQGSYRGTSGYDHGSAIAFDSNGDVFLSQVVGAGDASDTTGGAQDTFGGTYDVLITKFNKELTTIYQSTYFGGTGADYPSYNTPADTIYIDSGGNVYLTIYGRSAGLATAGAYQTSFGRILLAKFNNDLTDLLAATYLGGTATPEVLTAVGSYDDDFIYVYTGTLESSLPGTSCAIQETRGGSYDGVIARFSNDLTHLYQTTYIGGSNTEIPSFMLFDGDYLYVAGSTTSTNFPGVSGGAQDTYGGSTDAFVSKMSIYLDTGCALTPPVITSVESAPSLTSAIITWTTDKVSSSKAKYGVTTNYGNNTDEADFTNFSGVTSHSMTLTNLESCTTFHFKVSSRGYESDFASSSDYTFTTGGCASPGGGGGGGGLGGGSTYVGETVVWTSPLLPPTTPEPQPQPEPETPPQPEEPTVTEPEPEPVVVEEPIIKEEEPEPVVVEEPIIKEEEPEPIKEEPETPTVEEPVTNTETPQQPVVTTPVATESFFDVVKEQAKDTFNGAKEVLLDTREEVKKVLETKEGNIASKTVTTLGVVGGASFALATTLFATPLSFSEVVLIPFRLWSLILGAFGLKRKTRRWGVVYDSITKQPLDPAYVTLKNLEGKEVASTLTDLDGRYGFLVPPGTYALMASKTNYLFPSSKLAGKAEDELYNNIYWGDYFTLAEGGVITKNIPLDPEKFDWNEFEKNKKNMMRSFKRRFVFFARLSNILFSFGFIVALIALLVVPRPYNVMIFVLYVLILLLKKIGIKTKNQGSVTEKETGLPLSFGIIRVWRPDMSQEIAHTVIDQTGHFYCLVQNGTYKITIEKKNQDDGYTTIFTSEPLDVKKGVVNVDFEI